MSNFNNYTQFFKQVQKIPFEIMGTTFTVKDSQTNSLLIIEANKMITEINLEMKKLENKADATEVEKTELSLKQIEIYNIFRNCLNNVLGPTQFKKLEEMDLKLEAYMTIFRIVSGLINGQTHEQIIKELAEEEAMGEQEENQEN